MKIKVVGAAGGEVTGSSYFLHTDRAQILIDAGMFQGGKGSEAKNRMPDGVSVPSLDAVLLTHAHLDHTGRVPLLIKHGFRNRIFATGATIDLAELILKDSAKIQAQDAERANRRTGVAKDTPIEPLYGPADVTPFRSMAREVRFHEPLEVAPGITARWIEAGHMLGSASIELVVIENGRQKRIVFSGDLGPISRPIVRDFESPGQADLVFLESTYGDRDPTVLIRKQWLSLNPSCRRASRRVAKCWYPVLPLGAPSRSCTISRSCSSKRWSNLSRFSSQPHGHRSFEIFHEAPRSFR